MPTKPQGVTPSQTVGPYFAYGLTSNGQYDWNDAFTNNLVTPDATGERIRVEGRVFDGDGQADVMFGVTDGRLFIYKTGLAYHKEKMQWPTMLGNFQHTGSWKRPGK